MQKILMILYLILCVLLSSCTYADFICDYGAPYISGKLNHEELSEVSGLAFSWVYPEYMWAHNDSGSDSVLYLLSKSGEVVGKWQIMGAKATDWEDIAVGSCEDGSPKSCIFIADTGNNTHNRQDLSVIVVEEPTDLTTPLVWKVGESGELTVKYVISLEFQGLETESLEKTHPNIESLMVDPRSGEVYLISKSVKGKESYLYKVAWLPEKREVVPEVLGAWLFSAVPLFGSVTGADFSKTGEHFVIRTFWNAYAYDVAHYGSVEAAFQHPQSIFLIGEKQGEAIAFEGDGTTLWTTAEGTFQRIYKYGCNQSPKAVPELF